VWKRWCRKIWNKRNLEKIWRKHFTGKSKKKNSPTRRGAAASTPWLAGGVHFRTATHRRLAGGGHLRAAPTLGPTPPTGWNSPREPAYWPPHRASGSSTGKRVALTLWWGWWNPATSGSGKKEREGRESSCSALHSGLILWWRRNHGT
jgi:hypothetical protein